MNVISSTVVSTPRSRSLAARQARWGIVFAVMLVTVPFGGTAAAFAETTPSPIAVGHSPVAVAVGPNSENVYAVNQDDNMVSVIHQSSQEVVFTIPVGQAPTAVAVGPDWKIAYVTNGAANTVSVIDAASQKVTSTIPVGKSPMAVAAAPDGKNAYVANNADNTVSVLPVPAPAAP